MGTTKRTAVGGALLALVLSGLGGAPASADRDDPPPDDRGILEHEVDADMSLPYGVFYPAADRYRDRLFVRVFESPSTDEVMRSITIEVKDGAGAVVHNSSIDPAALAASGSVRRATWDGMIDGALAPEGTYAVEATIVDSSNDRKVVTKQVRLDRARIRDKVWRRTFRAAAVLIDRDVRGCADLKKPARPGWRGSLGYRSRCRSGVRSVVSTVHGVYLPRPFRGWHDWVRLSMTGGDAAGGPRSRLTYVYFETNGDWSRHSYQFGSSLGTHRGVAYKGRAAVQGRGTDDRPAFIWSVGLCCRRGYDVKSFTVTTRYQVLK